MQNSLKEDCENPVFIALDMEKRRPKIADSNEKASPKKPKMVEEDEYDQ